MVFDHHPAGAHSTRLSVSFIRFPTPHAFSRATLGPHPAADRPRSMARRVRWLLEGVQLERFLLATLPFCSEERLPVGAVLL